MHLAALLASACSTLPESTGHPSGAVGRRRDQGVQLSNRERFRLIIALVIVNLLLVATTAALALAPAIHGALRDSLAHAPGAVMSTERASPSRSASATRSPGVTASASSAIHSPRPTGTLTAVTMAPLPVTSPGTEVAPSPPTPPITSALAPRQPVSSGGPPSGRRVR